MLFRDVVERYGVSQVAALRWLVRQCLRNPAGKLSVHRLHQDLKAIGHEATKSKGFFSYFRVFVAKVRVTNRPDGPPAGGMGGTLARTWFAVIVASGRVDDRPRGLASPSG